MISALVIICFLSMYLLLVYYILHLWFEYYYLFLIIIHFIILCLFSIHFYSSIICQSFIYFIHLLYRFIYLFILYIYYIDLFIYLLSINFLQLQVDPGNQEAQQHLDNLEPIKNEIKDAKYFHERGEYQSSIDLLTRAIEVSQWYV